MKKILSILLLSFMLPNAVKAQLEAIGYIEYGYSMFRYNSDELPVFLNSYNNYQPGLTQKFETKMPVATGDYLKFGVGIGANCKMILDFTVYKMKSGALEARFGNGTGRDIWFEHRCSNTDIGIRFGGTKEVKPWIQFDMNVAVQTTTIYSAYVYSDGSRSLGIEKTLNGVYSSFVFTGGIGVTGGYRIAGPLGVSVSGGYMFNGSRKHPEYYQFTDLNNVKPSMDPDYLPRDMATYIADPYNSGNAISNDFRGWKFTAGLVCSIGNW